MTYLIKSFVEKKSNACCLKPPEKSNKAKITKYISKESVGMEVIKCFKIFQTLN